MSPESSKIIADVAYRLAKDIFLPNFQDGDGSFLCLESFNEEQLHAFAQVAQDDTINFPNLGIQFPRSVFRTVTIPDQFLTNGTAVTVRTTRDISLITITCGNEDDTKESLGNTEKISFEDLRNARGVEKLWTEAIAAAVAVPQSSNVREQLQVLVKAFITSDQFNLTMVVDYLFAFTKRIHTGSGSRATAGELLPMIGLPLHSTCFTQIPEDKLLQPSQWKQKLVAHIPYGRLLDKTKPNYDPVDDDEIAKILKTTIEDIEAKGSPPTSNEQKHFDAINAYIAANARSTATIELFENFEWDKNKKFFGSKERRQSGRTFSEDTKAAIIRDSKEEKGNEIDKDDLKILDALKSKKREEGKPTPEQRKLFQDHQDAIRDFSPKLLKEWENLIFGKKFECSNFIEGLFRCLKRIHSSDLKEGDVFLEVRALRQSKRNDFNGIPAETCIYFERHYSKLEKHTNGLIRFSNQSDHKTQLLGYEEWAKEETDQARNSKSKKAPHAAKPNANSTRNKKGFEFQVFLMTRKGKEEPVTNGHASLVWKFALNSVLKHEHKEIQSLLKKRKKTNSSTTVICSTSYDNSGVKGLPVTITLDSLDGFSGAETALGKGAFVPIRAKVRTVEEQYFENIQEEFQRQNIEEDAKTLLEEKFSAFDGVYRQTLEAFALDALDLETVPELTESYTVLLETIRSLENPKLRKSLTRWVLAIGSVSINASNLRPALEIICPWHPLRLEALWGQRSQIIRAFKDLITRDSKRFSDKRTGALYFHDIMEITSASLYPEIAVHWKKDEAFGMTAIESAGGYSLHIPFNHSQNSSSDEKSIKEAANTVMNELEEYLFLQPHEKDNVSLFLYDCHTPALPQRLVELLEKKNEAEKVEMNCEVLLSHSDNKKLQEVYKSLIASTEGNHKQSQSDGFLSKIRISANTAAAVISKPKKSNTPPVDIVFSKDLLTAESDPEEWIEVDREHQTETPQNLVSHRWTRQLPHTEQDITTRILHCCPTQTNAGWLYLSAISFVRNQNDLRAWKDNKALAPSRSLDHQKSKVSTFLDHCHKLGVWVVTQDEMLDRKILEANGIRVIRYIQSVSRGRNLVVSSKAKDTLLLSTLKARLSRMLPETPDDVELLKDLFIKGALEISGGLVMRAARQTNNTSELLGVVLSKFLVESEIGFDRAYAWCSLDDYSKWLGKNEGAQIADLLVFSPTYINGKPHLDIIVTEAKFIASSNPQEQIKKSKTQLVDTVSQIAEALSDVTTPLDQSLWLSRISDMILSRLINTGGQDKLASDLWRGIVRRRECSFSIRGYSHVFLSDDEVNRKTSLPGIELEGKNSYNRQEVYCYEDLVIIVKSLLSKDLTMLNKIREVESIHVPVFDLLLATSTHTEEVPVLTISQTDGLSDSGTNETGTTPAQEVDTSSEPASNTPNTQTEAEETENKKSDVTPLGVDPDILDFLNN